MDVNQNGRQDPGEPNLVRRRVQVTVRNAAGDLSQQVLTTDATGKYTVTMPGAVVIQAAGLFPANTEPANTRRLRLLPFQPTPEPPARSTYKPFTSMN